MTVHGEDAGPTHLSESVAPAPSTAADLRLDALVRERFDWMMQRHPVFATYLGLDEHDGRLGDGSRDALLAEIDAARAFATAVDAIDEASGPIASRVA